MKHSAKVHVWAAFSLMGTFPLCVFTQNLDTTLYLNVLECHLLQQAKVFHEEGWYLAQDVDPKHTSCLTKRWMVESIPKRFLDLPSQSTDVNSIESFFGWMKHHLSGACPKAIGELKEKLVGMCG